MKTKTISAGVFKNTSLKVIDEVQVKGNSVIITKHGKPIAKLVPIANSKRDDFYDFMKGKVEILGDIVGPVFSEEEWETD